MKESHHARSHEQRGQKRVWDRGAVSRTHLAALNGENSHARVLNVGEDSCEKRHRVVVLVQRHKTP